MLNDSAPIGPLMSDTFFKSCREFGKSLTTLNIGSTAFSSFLYFVRLVASFPRVQTLQLRESELRSEVDELEEIERAGHALLRKKLPYLRKFAWEEPRGRHDYFITLVSTWLINSGNAAQLEELVILQYVTAIRDCKWIAPLLAASPSLRRWDWSILPHDPGPVADWRRKLFFTFNDQLHLYSLIGAFIVDLNDSVTAKLFSPSGLDRLDLHLRVIGDYPSHSAKEWEWLCFDETLTSGLAVVDHTQVAVTIDVRFVIDEEEEHRDSQISQYLTSPPSKRTQLEILRNLMPKLFGSLGERLTANVYMRDRDWV